MVGDPTCVVAPPQSHTAGSVLLRRLLHKNVAAATVRELPEPIRARTVMIGPMVTLLVERYEFPGVSISFESRY
jgi:hypothetical protein